MLEELLLPRRIASLRGVRVLAIAAGTEHSLVLADGGIVYSFGAGGGGKLGHGDARFQWIPTRVRALPPGARVVAIAAGDAHSLCAVADGRVFGWGSGGLGMGLQPAEDPTTTVDHPPTTQQQLNAPDLADIALADIAIRLGGQPVHPRGQRRQPAHATAACAGAPCRHARRAWPQPADETVACVACVAAGAGAEECIEQSQKGHTKGKGVHLDLPSTLPYRLLPPPLTSRGESSKNVEKVFLLTPSGELVVPYGSC